MAYYREYCTGCGLCQNLKYTKMRYEPDGFPYPDTCGDDMNAFCEEVCPMGRNYLSKTGSINLWGDYNNYYIGYANDKDVRREASSGGILTAICSSLIETKKVDGIIQIKYSDEDPTETMTVLSKTVKEVKECSGSRYAVSMPLINISNIIEDGKRYAFVGKPCDVAALRNFAKKNEYVNKAVKYYLSFFCAGTPSRIANEQMLKTLGCPKSDCISFNYRGNGWPGKVTAIDSIGNKYEMDYYTAWMTVLGRIIRKSCKFCVDSIGESSDISCGDYWYLDEKGNPSFAEADGRNCIFTWTSLGSDLIDELEKTNRITLLNEDIDILKKVQPNHFNRRTTILYKWMAMKLLLKQPPKYSLKKMIGLAKYNSKRHGFKVFKGTVKRILLGKI